MLAATKRLATTWFGVKDPDRTQAWQFVGWRGGFCALWHAKVEEGERGGVGVGKGEQRRRAVIVWWCGGRLPEQDPTPFVRAARGGSWLATRSGSWLAAVVAVIMF